MGRGLKKSNTPFGTNKKGTFIIKLREDRKGTWQGKIIWAETNEIQRFRSGLELIALMDDAINKENLIAEEQGDDNEVTA
ncbi:hypothetical protein [Butyrivibrio sp. MC2021]|uniref:hypothetical protein n=1 Tax=Butyrivibrio sp. MC2021 TaxID=1408306 RepID=UPI000686D57C|nr:hypothetical protein [Butyrivibrio sp. MC2021]